MGIEVHRGLGGTGVVGVTRCKQGGNSPRSIGLRVDMYALPLTEANSFAHASTTRIVCPWFSETSAITARRSAMSCPASADRGRGGCNLLPFECNKLPFSLGATAR